ncbi:ATPase component BioM of energizing module of biotin ECF transporter [Desulfovibrio sp. DV]|uniref:helicase HerA-like domain-containing protein n=1 Tax=Desulfovibrio sp. DV TaxID=1844708 RepID=UPI00094BC467|nr:helicase HerA-like domain-containing protein [Desulfovibrio sp. DV]OLN26826.1 ATPase component BioM of energizing module of biotin ECF transporter [Desulfovibrio sp. DV]
MTTGSQPILLGRGPTDAFLLPAMANRHGLVSGATGTGKTVTLRVLAEAFSDLGVPVFLADVKGDLSGLAATGGDAPKILARAKELGLDLAPAAYPVVFWDVLGRDGIPLRTTVSEMGPLLLARLLGLNDTQSGVLEIVFRVADEAGLLLLDLKDLQAMATHVGDNAAAYRTRFGNVSTASVGAIQRALLGLESQGGALFFGEPALDLDDLLQTDASGRGVVNILCAKGLMGAPKVYAVMLLWLLAELFETLPEVGDTDKPRLVFFFDEAHLLFTDAPPALVEKIEQTVRLIRSKGVGIYFVTQSPLDLPDTVLSQLGNRVQHALRAFTPRDQRAVAAAADTFRPNPGLDTARTITELGVGEALASCLDAKGMPTVVERVLVVPPRSRMTPLSEAEKKDSIAASVLAGHYGRTLDRESAFERLQARADTREAQQPTARAGKSQAERLIGSMAESALRSIGTQIGRQIARGVLGALFGGKR